MPDTIEATRSGRQKAKVTLVVTPRDRFEVALKSLASIVEITDMPYELVYVDGSSPRRVSAGVGEICRKNGFRHVRTDHFLSPNAARNIGWRAADTPYVVFIDNDVVVSQGWLQALVDCADDTGAQVVAPVICQWEPLHTEIHHAGGRFADDAKGFFTMPPDQRRIEEDHLKQGERVGEAALERGETQACEFHCVLVRRDVLAGMGGLDERLLATKEHLDLSMYVWSNGGRVMFEPASVVTSLYPIPDRNRSVRLRDWPYFILRWSPQWQKRSLDHFQIKWQLPEDPYFRGRDPILSWRHCEEIATPIVRRIPLASRSRVVRRACEEALVRALRLWSRVLVARHGRQIAQGGPT